MSYDRSVATHLHFEIKMGTLKKIQSELNLEPNKPILKNKIKERYKGSSSFYLLSIQLTHSEKKICTKTLVCE